MKYRKKPVIVDAYQTDKEVIIHTLEGDMKASVGDYIITGVNGEQYPCKPDIFDRTYEMVEWDEALAKAIIESMPTIDPVKHGKWIDREKYRTTKDGVFHTYRFKVCSECGRGSGRKMNRPTPFCPNCGARMDGE